jgi:hypothetical protein
MAIRRRHKKGDWLVEDEVTGFVKYSSEISRDYLDTARYYKDVDYRNPQDFVRSLDDNSDVTFLTSRHEGPEADLCLPATVGDTNVSTPTDGAASHLYDVGIGDMEIGFNFCVR